MGYELQALIGKTQVLQLHSGPFQSARVVSLDQGIGIIPLTDELYEEIGGEGELDTFYKFSPQLEEWARLLSQHAPVAYVEAEYFGGVGGQNAIAWSKGGRILGPLHAENAINQALKLLGVSSADIAGDEFDAVGLGKHRDTASWLQEPGPH
jgi:hypothetical protein